MKWILSKFKRSVRRSNPLSARDITLPEATGSASPAQSVIPISHSVAAALAVQTDAPLENLPPEVRRRLLLTLDLKELSALVHASPTFHQQYILDRRYLLCQCLQTTLRTVTIDAYAVYQSGVTDCLGPRTSERVNRFLESYRDRRSSLEYSIVIEKLTEDEARDIVAFHFSIIEPLAQHFTRCSLAYLADVTRRPPNCEPLSKMEETRLLRALYRFQLCCNLFGKGRYGISKNPRSEFRSEDILKNFICMFEPWEVEEIACIYAFAKEEYDQIFRDIRWDVHEENPKFEGQRPPTPEGAFDLDNGWVRSSLLKGTISRGLRLLHTVLFMTKDHENLVSTMQERISWPAGYFLEDEALGETEQYLRRHRRLSNRDRKQQRRDPLPFAGDEGPDMTVPRPPLAWTLMWGGTYSNLYGHYVQDVIRRWGYVMWDAKRLEDTGAKEILAQQWEDDWGDSDPRDSLM